MTFSRKGQAPSLRPLFLCTSSLYSFTVFLIVFSLCLSQYDVNCQITFSNEFSSSSDVALSMCCNMNLNADGTFSKCGTGGNGGNIQASGRNDAIIEGRQGAESETSKSSTGTVKGKRQIEQPIEWTFPSSHTANNRSTRFRLEFRIPECSAGTLTHVFQIDDGSSNNTFFVQKDRQFRIGDLETFDLFSLDQYCINGLGTESIQLITCKPPCTKEEPCITKCCPLDQVVSPFHPKKCSDTGHTKWSPIYYKGPSNPESRLSMEEASRKKPFYRVLHPRILETKCSLGTSSLFTNSHDLSLFATMFEFHVFRMGENGKIYIRDAWRNWATDEESNCIDGIQDANPEGPHPFNPEELVFISCPTPEEETRRVNKYFGILATVSSPFALLTVIVYALLWEKQTIHGWTIMSYSATVFLLFVFFGASHLIQASEEHSDENKVLESVGCKVIGTISHFLFISMFAWLTMISLDLWLTFRTMTIASARSKGFKRFLMYCGFGWGIPMFMIILSWSLELKYANDENSEVKVPLYGQHSCYVTSLFFWEFIYGVCAILYAVNFLFFILTTWKLIEYKRSTRLATKTAQNQQSYFLFVKLFLVVGVLWMFEIISVAVSGVDVTLYWQFFDTINCLQPVAIFFIFIFKYDMVNALAEKYPKMKPCLVPLLRFFGLCDKRRRHQLSKRPGVDEESTALSSTSKTNTTNVLSKPEPNNSFELTTK